jgi:quercetin dioxygenase-like cupin family protein
MPSRPRMGHSFDASNQLAPYPGVRGTNRVYGMEREGAMQVQWHGWRRVVGVAVRLRALLSVCLMMATVAVLPTGVAAHDPCTATQSVSKGLGEKTTKQLPAGPLYWRLETFATKAAADGAAGPTAISFEAGGKAWLATLAARGGSTAGGTLVADIGPLPAPQAAEYRLRVQQRVSQPGCEGDIHSHPGAEAWYMLAGEQTVITPGREQRITAGQSLVGPPGGTPMQLAYRGTGESDALTFLLLDAAQPNSTPATLPSPSPSSPPLPGPPKTGAGGGQAQFSPAQAALVTLVAMLPLALLLLVRRARQRKASRTT